VTTLGRDAFRDRTRSAKRQVKRIEDAIRQRTEQAAAARQSAYRQLIRITTQIVQQAQQVAATLHDQASSAAQHLVATLDQLLPRVRQVIDQTRRRVLQGEQVPASEKLVSLFEPHTAIICKDKRPGHTAFGRLIWLDELDGGLISRYAVLSGNPKEAGQVVPSVDHHLARFHKPPHLLAGDRGTYSARGERYAQERGVKQVVLPKPGAKSPARVAYEQQRWFRRGRHWRAGIEGRISGLKRGQGLSRCRYHGEDGMERWVGWGLITHGLHKIAQATAA
jgi:IS5 family transposase